MFWPEIIHQLATLTYLLHCCMPGMGNATHFPAPQSSPTRTWGSQICRPSCHGQAHQWLLPPGHRQVGSTQLYLIYLVPNSHLGSKINKHLPESIYIYGTLFKYIMKLFGVIFIYFAILYSYFGVIYSDFGVTPSKVKF